MAALAAIVVGKWIPIDTKKTLKISIILIKIRLCGDLVI